MKFRLSASKAAIPHFKPINNDAEHHRILCEMGVLDDLENWPLFQQQQQRLFEEVADIDAQTWRRYVVCNGRRPAG